MKKIITLFAITATFSSCSFFSNAAKEAPRWRAYARSLARTLIGLLKQVKLWEVQRVLSAMA